MPRSTPVFTRFNTGEISPQMLGRLDTPHYAAAALHAHNVLLRPQGGFRRRSGTRFLGETKDRDRQVRLFPFADSEFDSYIVEVGHEYLRMWREDALLRAPAVATSISNGAFAANITGWTDRSDQDAVESVAAPPPPSPPPPSQSVSIEDWTLTPNPPVRGQLLTFAGTVKGGADPIQWQLESRPFGFYFSERKRVFGRGSGRTINGQVRLGGLDWRIQLVVFHGPQLIQRKIQLPWPTGPHIVPPE